MGNKLREIFDPSPEEEIKRIERMLYVSLMLNYDVLYKGMEIVKCDGSDFLYMSRPFIGFIGDCDFCTHIYNNFQGVSTGGQCDLHNEACGYGFICKDYDGKYPTDFNNPYASILENDRKWMRGNLKRILELRTECEQSAERR